MQMAGSLFPAVLAGAAQSLGSRLHYLSLSTTRALMEALEQLEGLIIEHGIRLVVLDSAAALVRKEYGRDALAERQRLLGQQASLLKRLAENFGIPVVVTNQMTTHRSELPATGEEPTEQLAAALGNTWAHAVNTRLELRRDADGHRELSITKSPVSSTLTIPVDLSTQGLVAVAASEEGA